MAEKVEEAYPAPYKPTQDFKGSFTLTAKLGLWSRFLLERGVHILFRRRPNFDAEGTFLGKIWDNISEYSKVFYQFIDIFYKDTPVDNCAWVEEAGPGEVGLVPTDGAYFIESLYLDDTLTPPVVRHGLTDGVSFLRSSKDEGKSWQGESVTIEGAQSMATHTMTRISPSRRLPAAPLTYIDQDDVPKPAPLGFTVLEIPDEFRAAEPVDIYASGDNKGVCRLNSFGICADIFSVSDYTEPNIPAIVGACTMTMTREFLQSNGHPAYTHIPPPGWNLCGGGEWRVPFSTWPHSGGPFRQLGNSNVHGGAWFSKTIYVNVWDNLYSDPYGPNKYPVGSTFLYDPPTVTRPATGSWAMQSFERTEYIGHQPQHDLGPVSGSGPWYVPYSEMYVIGSASNCVAACSVGVHLYIVPATIDDGGGGGVFTCYCTPPPGTETITFMAETDYYWYPYGGARAVFDMFPFAYWSHAGSYDHWTRVMILLNGELCWPKNSLGGFDAQYEKPDGGYISGLYDYCTGLATTPPDILWYIHKDNYNLNGGPKLEGFIAQVPPMAYGEAGVEGFPFNVDATAWCRLVAGTPTSYGPLSNSGYADTPHGKIYLGHIIDTVNWYPPYASAAHQHDVEKGFRMLISFNDAGKGTMTELGPESSSWSLWSPLKSVVRWGPNRAIGVTVRGAQVTTVVTEDGGATWAVRTESPYMVDHGRCYEVIPMSNGQYFYIFTEIQETVIPAHGEGEDYEPEHTEYTETVGIGWSAGKSVKGELPSEEDNNIIHQAASTLFNRAHIRIAGKNTVVYLKTVNDPGLPHEGGGGPLVEDAEVTVDVPAGGTRLYKSALGLPDYSTLVQVKEMTYIPPVPEMEGAPALHWTLATVQNEVDTITFSPSAPILGPVFYGPEATGQMKLKFDYWPNGLQYDVHLLEFAQDGTMTDTVVGHMDESARRLEGIPMWAVRTPAGALSLLGGNDWKED